MYLYICGEQLKNLAVYLEIIKSLYAAAYLFAAVDVDIFGLLFYIAFEEA